MWKPPTVKKNTGSPTTGDPLRDMRLSVVVMMLCASVLCRAQSSDTLVHHHRLKCIGVFASGGVGVPQYYSDKYFEFLAKESFSPADGSPVPNILPIEDQADITKDVTPSILGRDAPPLGPFLNCGVVFGRGAHLLSIDHAVIVGYSRTRAKFTSSSRYYESLPGAGHHWGATVSDTIRNQMDQTCISLGYQLRATYKHLWLGAGVGLSHNKVRMDQEGTSHVVGGSNDKIGPIVPYSRVQPYRSSDEVVFLGFSLEGSCGLRFQVDRLVLLPAIYVSTVIGKEYLFQRAVLEVQYEFK